ncbi:hypothetical protein BV20DRAFT_486954 [Pilatotrama ljubarskyi]|nr:hypothetical protein BV20DRAFT_486954 [Pilatotrama ljubarskyi]
MQANRHHTASPFISPSTSPGAMSQAPSDSEWSTGDWNLGTPAHPSRTTTPALSAGRASPQHGLKLSQEHLEHFIKYLAAAQANTTPDNISAGAGASLPNMPVFHPTDSQTSSRPGTPETPKRKRIPRPPNAFMLYRSHLLKTRQIPPGIEHRQQNISRVAGECWNMLPEEEKRKWHDKAKEVLTAHMAKHPDYKFSPERKTARRKTPQDPEIPATDGKDYIRFLREKYLGLKGPAVNPPRPRKPKSRRGVESDGLPSLSLPPSLQSSPSSSPSPARVVSAPPSLTSSPAVHHSPPKFDLNIFQTYDMGSFPPASLSQENLAYYASHTAQSSAFDDDVTPKASTFGDITLPAQPKFNFPPTFNYPACASTAESHLGLHGLVLPGSVTGVPQPGSSRPTTPAPQQPPAFDRMWDSLIRDPFGNGGAPDPSGSGPLDDPANSPFASGELSGPIDFEHMHFPSLFPHSE